MQLARHAFLWTAGPLVLAFRGPLTELTPAPRCTGAVDLIAIAIARRWLDMTIGQIAGGMSIVATVGALGCFAELVDRTTRNAVVAFAVTCAFGITLAFPSELGLPWEMSACGACACAALAIRRADRRPTSWRAVVGIWTVLLLAASIVPAWTAVSAIGAATLAWQIDAPTWKRVAAAATGAGVVCAAPLTILYATQTAGLMRAHPWSACAWAPHITRLRGDLLAGVVHETGPIVLALAALGAWVAGIGADLKRSVLGAAVLALALVPGLGGDWRTAVVLAPVLVGVWWLSGVGLREMIRSLGSRRRQTPALALAALFLPFLQWTVVGAQRRAAIVGPLGHERASLRQIRSALNLLPPGSHLVEEDASVDVLLRAALFGRRAGKPLAIVPLNRRAVLDALQRSPVYAFPLGQRELGLRGFAVEAVDDPLRRGDRIHGVAVISRTRTCAEVGKSWVDLGGVGASGRISVSAESAGAEGPVVMYFNGTTSYAPGPDAWPSGARRGFDVRILGRRSAEESAQLDAEAIGNGLQRHPVFASPFVVRLVVYRTPQAPLALPIVLGPPRSEGVGRLLADYPGALPLTICDAPPSSVIEF